MDKYIGKKLDGRYEMLEVIGVGGMAMVYKAVDTLTNNIVAVKIMKDEYVANEEFRQRFRNESKAIALLSHKNIVRIYDVSTNPNLQYIVMEYIDGITLKDYIDQQGALGWKEAVHFTSQILRALQHAHEKGIIHRDIKPQNIMLLQNGEIKVTDFGIARLSGDNSGAAKTTRTIGSVHYISPEQARGSQTDARSDVYSVGVMLYEMLTGQLPFEADDTVSVAVMQMQADPRMPREINPSIPQGLEEITMQAMQKDPGFRYQTAADMIMDIDDFKRDPSVCFDYRYMSDNSPARYINAIYNTRRLQEHEEQVQEKSPVIPVLSGIALAFVMVALVMVWLVLDESGIFATNTNATTDVPNFIGQNYLEITANPDYSSFQFLIERDFSNDYAEDLVMNQSPKAGRSVYSNAKITLTVSNGVERLLVPEYSGMSYDEYSEECIMLNIVPKKIEVYDDTVESGYVINTNPQPRSDISEGETVEIYVSQGKKPETLLMPNCQNMLYTDAKQKLAAMGITNTSIVEVESEKQQGTILSQDPSAGTKIIEGETTVKFTVSNGKAPTKSVSIELKLPEGLSSQSLRVEMTLDGETVYQENINTEETDKIVTTISGSGSSRTVKVYLAGSLYASLGINFTTGEIKSQTINPDYQLPTSAAATVTTAAVVDN